MTATPARRFRVVRGTEDFPIGANVAAADARAAVAADAARLRKAGPLGAFAGAEPAPVLAVFELVPVPAADWR